MTTSHTSFLTEILDGKCPIPERKLAYFRERQRNRLYDFIVSKFLERESSENFTRSDLARRMHKRREQITRILSSPGNWTLDTISDLSLAIYGEELEFVIRPFNERPSRNSTSIDLLSQPVENKNALMQDVLAPYEYNQQTAVYGLGKQNAESTGIFGAQK